MAVRADSPDCWRPRHPRTYRDRFILPQARPHPFPEASPGTPTAAPTSAAPPGVPEKGSRSPSCMPIPPGPSRSTAPRPAGGRTACGRGAGPGRRQGPGRAQSRWPTPPELRRTRLAAGSAAVHRARPPPPAPRRVVPRPRRAGARRRGRCPGTGRARQVLLSLVPAPLGAIGQHGHGIGPIDPKAGRHPPSPQGQSRLRAGRRGVDPVQPLGVPAVGVCHRGARRPLGEARQPDLPPATDSIHGGSVGLKLASSGPRRMAGRPQRPRVDR